MKTSSSKRLPLVVLPTLGEWALDEFEPSLVVAVSGDLESGESRKAIGTAYLPAGGTHEEMLANAALFAASKRMLAALWLAKSVIDSGIEAVDLEKIESEEVDRAYLAICDAIEDAIGIDPTGEGEEPSGISE